ncbi:hypothetical protein Ple7327_4114 [Pleurocapsa sp. PCC 7327]|nr:hypothetical protein Ple7327_4114 [Pleurocapsa sp. PCC 7327]
MLKIEQVIKQDRLLRALTGLNRKAFESLLPTFNEFYQQTITEQDKQLRQRAVGGGRKAILETGAAKLFFISFYFKCYPTFDLAGFIFGMHRSLCGS